MLPYIQGFRVLVVNVTAVPVAYFLLGWAVHIKVLPLTSQNSLNFLLITLLQLHSFIQHHAFEK